MSKKNWLIIAAIVFVLLAAAVVIWLVTSDAPAPQKDASRNDSTQDTDAAGESAPEGDPSEGETGNNDTPGGNGGGQETPDNNSNGNQGNQNNNNTGNNGNNNHNNTGNNTEVATDITFPYQIPGYDLVIERMAPYKGLFVETGENVVVENVAMLQVVNKGTTAVEYAQITVQCGEDTLTFELSALAEGARMVVQEKSCKPMTTEVTDIAVTVALREDMDLSEEQVQVTDNGDNTITVTNLTDEPLVTVRVFYKYYMQEEDIFVGGIAFTVRITRLAPSDSITLQPAHFTSASSKVVMVLTYDSEV